MLTPKTPSGHTWKFYRIGGLDQVALENGPDLANLKHLDPKLWVALSCPVKGLELDEKTLALIDTDNDGRIRVPELLAAIEWSALVLNDLGILLKDSATVPLSAFNSATPAGLAALTSAKRILASLGKADASSISLAEASDTVRLFASTHLNGDGIITADSTASDDLKLLVAQIISTHGAQPDRSGVSGIDQARLDAFYADATAFTAWSDRGAAADVLTLGASTAAATAAVQAVSAKVDDYFSRTRLAAYDSRALAALNRSETEYLTLAAKDLSITASEVAGFPLARIAANQPLPLLAGVNPAWATALATLHASAVAPVFGAAKTELSEADWTALKSKVATFGAWSGTKAGAAVEPLGLERVKAILAANKQAELSALIAKDKALEPEFNAIASVEKILRYTRDFRALLHNFVNFFDFYSPDYLATFQAGTLYLDNRSTEFCIEVAGPAPLAAMSKAYIAYCDLKRAGSAPRKIAACFTQGDSDFLFVGRNGLFYDRQGRDWDAVITAIVDNPISVRQAFFSPYKKFVRMIEEQAAKRAAAADAESNARLAAAAEKTANADKAQPAPPKKFDVGVIAALGVAAGALGTVLGGLIGGFLGLGMWMPLGVLGIILVISGPSMAIAWLKLRQRNLGPILEANGWAINGRVKINIPFGTKLTERAVLPKGSELNLTDPYEDKKSAAQRRRVSVLLVLAGIVGGLFWQHESTGYYPWDSAATKQQVRDERAAAAALEKAKADLLKKDAEAKAASK
jgi:hypothetical protein